MAMITRAIHHYCKAIRDYAVVRGSFLLGCRVSEIAVIKWKAIGVLSDGGQFTSLEKDLKQGLFEFPVTRSR